MQDILQKLKTTKIANMQLDPNGHCNVGCWYCPVRYLNNPSHAKKQMSEELLYKILKDVDQERKREDGLVSPNFSGFYTAHYNEILLYKHFHFLLEACRSLGFQFMILSNGTTLTKQKVDLIAEYPDVVNGLNLNTPIFTDANKWSKRVNAKPEMHQRVIENIYYATEKLPKMVEHKTFSIVVNGITERSLLGKGGWIELGEKFDQDIDLDVHKGEHAQEVNKAKELFPSLQIYGNPSLIDRAGLISSVIDNKEAIVKFEMKGNKDKKVIGCQNAHEVGGRPFGWIHVNANGECFLCCNDYSMMQSVFGSFEKGKLRDFWVTEKHAEVIEHSYETMCRTCASAKFN